MHGLPKNFDASVFVGAVVETVTFAANAIHVSFGPELSVTAQRHVRYRLSSHATLRDDVLPVDASGVMALIGHRVESAEIGWPGDLTLELEDGGSLLLEDDSQHYESYTLRTPNGETFV